MNRAWNGMRKPALRWERVEAPYLVVTCGAEGVMGTPGAFSNGASMPRGIPASQAGQSRVLAAPGGDTLTGGGCRRPGGRAAT